ncbi:hypothetical protein AAS21_gp102 [Pantoea phage vB_PagS_AAS21]|uniref:Uncharacterized protein n=1 Tax=Pantoea phage vB_PagS_AAS21 TaxID=2575261 RepID=A0A4Y5P1K0_9CAUD|nr:hypothetical protein AAS21_gp102 [Pantoea phage vB_PagS_AAS21]
MRLITLEDSVGTLSKFLTTER